MAGVPLMKRRKSDTHWEVIYAISWGNVPSPRPSGIFVRKLGKHVSRKGDTTNPQRI